MLLMRADGWRVKVLTEMPGASVDADELSPLMSNVGVDGLA